MIFWRKLLGYFSSGSEETTSQDKPSQIQPAPPSDLDDEVVPAREKLARLGLLAPSLTPEQSTLLKRYEIKYLYHMTHKSNLSSILDKGLLSHNAAHSGGHNTRNIADSNVTNIRSQKVDSVHGRLINDYVPLYFNPKNAMLYVRRSIQHEIVMLGIDPSILFAPNSIFTDGNAASGGTSFYKDPEYLNRLNWNCIRGARWNTFMDGRRIRCAEVLVYPTIPLSLIRAVSCGTSGTLEEIKPLLRTQSQISLDLERSHYF